MSDDLTITFGEDVAGTLRKAAAHLRREAADFELEDQSDTSPARLCDATIRELVNLRTMARAAADAFSEAISAQAERHAVKKGALRRYVVALEADKMADLDAEAEDLARLMTREDAA